MLPVIALVLLFSGFAKLKDLAAISRLEVHAAQPADPVRDAIALLRVEPPLFASVRADEILVVPPNEVGRVRAGTEVRAADPRQSLLEVVADVGPIIIAPVAVSNAKPVEIGHAMPSSASVWEANNATAYARLTISDAARGLVPAREARSCFAKGDTHRVGFEQGATQFDFGIRLARAALRQSREFVFYTDRYFPISYPGGDVPSFYGVCSDVVVRAYRELDIDLQVRVHESGVGIGDRSIDHRRVSVLKRFFAKYGEALRVTGEGASYRPGDIVTYFRPRNTGTRTHIAIVSELIGASGNPMIIHNRGNGVQVEDALFGDPITGHFRYGGHDESVVHLADRARGSQARMTAMTLRDQAAR